MRCLHCGKRISILRKLADGEFCSAEHRQLFQQQQNDLALARLIESQRRIERPGAPVAKAEPPVVKAQPPKETRKQVKETEEAAAPWAAFLPLPHRALPSRRMQIPAVVSLWREGMQCLPHGEFDTLIGGMSQPGRTPVFESGLCLGSAMKRRRLPGTVECWSSPAPFVPRLAGQAMWSVPVVEAPAAEEAVPPFARLVGISMASAPLRTSEEAQALPAPLPVSAKLSGGSGPAQRWIPAGGRFDEDGAPPWAPAVSLPFIKPAHAPAGMSEPGTGWAAEDESAALPAGWLVSRAAHAAALSEGVVAPVQPPAVMTRVSYAVPSAATAILSRMDDRAACLRHDSSVVAPALPSAGRRLLPLALSPQRASAPVNPALVAAVRPASMGSALPASCLDADQTAYWNVVDRLTAVEQTGQAGEAIQGMLPAGSTGQELHSGAEAEGVSLTGGLEPEPEPAPLQTRLCPILVWQIADCPRGDFRTPDLRGLAKWAEQAHRPPSLPRFQSPLDGADRAALSRPGRPPRLKARPFALLRSRLDFLIAGRFWAQAPADLRWIAVGMPLILALVLYSFRSTQPKAGEAGVKLATAPTSSILGSQFASVHSVITERAAVHLVDDFRSGLSLWEGQPGWSKTWKYSDATFLEPGQLAFFSPTMRMSDYTLEFLGQIERQGLSWVVRAKDHRNFVALRIVLTRPGPLPAASMVRYTVIDGREGPVTTLPIPFPVKSSTMYRIRMEVRGEDFTTYIQGQVVDHFTEKRLESGGVGFYSSRNERSLLRWVEVTHQYDYLGRLCALFAPYDVQAGADKAD